MENLCYELDIKMRSSCSSYYCYPNKKGDFRKMKDLLKAKLKIDIDEYEYITETKLQKIKKELE
jgi:hypothetical protein